MTMTMVSMEARFSATDMVLLAAEEIELDLQSLRRHLAGRVRLGLERPGPLERGVDVDPLVRIDTGPRQALMRHADVCRPLSPGGDRQGRGQASNPWADGNGREHRRALSRGRADRGVPLVACGDDPHRLGLER